MKRIVSSSLYFYFLLIVILFPIIFFPISSDISIFALGGKTIAQGGNIYADYLDLKPPMIFIIYAFLYKIIGISEIALRLFDVILQMFTAILIFRFVKDYFENKNAAIFSAIAYSLSYSTLSYSQTLDPESFVGLIIMYVLFLINKNSINTLLKYFIIGVLLGFMASMKFTMATVPFCIIFFDLFIKKIEKKGVFINTIILLTGFLVIFALSFIPIINHESWNNFNLVMEYLKFHSSQPPINAEFIKESIKNIGIFFGDNYSIALIIFLTLGFSVYNKFKSKGSFDNFSLILLILIALFISIAAERKFSIYHFSRMYALLSIIVGFGASIYYNNIQKVFKTSAINKIMMSIALIFILLLSPVPRLVNNYIPTAQYFLNKDKYNHFYQRNDAQNIRETYLKTAKKINYEITDKSLGLIIAIGGNQINYFFKDAKYSKFSQSLFYFGNFKVQRWQEEFERELESAKIVAVQTNDIHPILTGHTKSSFQLLSDSKYNDYFLNNFHLIDTNDCFRIYKRK